MDEEKAAAFKKQAIKRALTISLIVGTLLIAINQGDFILAGQVPNLWKAGLTYIVPFCVSLFSALSAQKNM